MILFKVKQNFSPLSGGITTQNLVRNEFNGE